MVDRTQSLTGPAICKKERRDYMKIKQVMTDGSVRDSIEGLMLPADHPVYKALVKALKEKHNSDQAEERESKVS